MTSALGNNGSTHKWRKIRAAILRRDNNTCHWCGGEANTVDHLTPRAIDPSDSPANLVAACTRCNSSRGGKLNKALRQGKKQSDPFLAPGDTPVSMSVSHTLSDPPLGKGTLTKVFYSQSTPTERKKR